MLVTRAGPLLAATRLDQFRPLGALGEPAYLAHARLCAALEGLGALDCARYFARPEPDRYSSSYRRDGRPYLSYLSYDDDDLYRSSSLRRSARSSSRRRP